MIFTTLSNKNYWIYFFSIMLSLIGIDLFVYTQGWYVLYLTGSNLSVGLSWSIFFTPSLLFMPVIGNMLDLIDVKKVLIVFEIGKALVLLIFVPILMYFPNVYTVYIMSGLFGIFLATFFPSIYVVLKMVVSDSEISKYSHMFELSVQIGSSVAILLAGFLYKKLGFLLISGMGGVLILLSALILLTLNITADNKYKSFSVIQEYKNFFRGIKTIRKQARLENKHYLFGMFHQFPQSIVLATNIPLLLYVHDVMNKGPVTYGLLDALMGIAAIFAGIYWTKHYAVSQDKKNVLLMSSLTAISFLIVAFIPADGVIPYVVFCLGAMFITSSKMQCRAAILKITPGEVIGRMTAFYQTFNYIVTVLLAFILSYLCQHMSIKNVYIVVGMIIFAFTFFMQWSYREDVSPIRANRNIIPQ